LLLMIVLPHAVYLVRRIMKRPEPDDPAFATLVDRTEIFVELLYQPAEA
jgi:hypothetical protein